jgi:hypothetical protein
LDSQSIFVIGKQIMDEILVANKVVDYAKWWKKEMFIF